MYVYDSITALAVPGSFTSWAVAGREAECLTGVKMEKGWVAVGYCYKTEAEIKVPRSSASARKKKVQSYFMGFKYL